MRARGKIRISRSPREPFLVRDVSVVFGALSKLFETQHPVGDPGRVKDARNSSRPATTTRRRARRTTMRDDDGNALVRYIGRARPTRQQLRRSSLLRPYRCPAAGFHGLLSTAGPRRYPRPTSTSHNNHPTTRRTAETGCAIAKRRTEDSDAHLSSPSDVRTKRWVCVGQGSDAVRSTLTLDRTDQTFDGRTPSAVFCRSVFPDNLNCPASHEVFFFILFSLLFLHTRGTLGKSASEKPTLESSNANPLRCTYLGRVRVFYRLRVTCVHRGRWILKPPGRPSETKNIPTIVFIVLHG
jgi:hypothetical protein